MCDSVGAQSRLGGVFFLVVIACHLDVFLSCSRVFCFVFVFSLKAVIISPEASPAH